MEQLTIERAEGYQVWLADGTPRIDLVSGFGSVFMGHSRPSIVAAVSRQLHQAWSTGRANSSALEQAKSSIQAVLPGAMRYSGLYSTGMESAEYAMRLAAAETGKSHFAGFQNSMHGKSAMTAALCWPNSLLAGSNSCSHIIPISFEDPAELLLERTESTLKSNPIAALFIEPLQGSNRGHSCPPDLCHQLIALCRSYDTLCVFDEVLTGLHRTGPRFYCEQLSQLPDILIFGKSIGNGFPASAIAVGDSIHDSGAALPGSTFSENPLAAAAVVATLKEMAAFDMVGAVGEIGAATSEILATLGQAGFELRGSGALSILQVPSSISADTVGQTALARGVIVSVFGDRIRLLPPATIDIDKYRAALNVVAESCTEQITRRRPER